VEHVGLAQTRVTSHLGCLANCGFVRVRRAGRNAYYQVHDLRITELVQLAQAVSAENRTALAVCGRIPLPDEGPSGSGSPATARPTAAPSAASPPAGVPAVAGRPARPAGPPAGDAAAGPPGAGRPGAGTPGADPPGAGPRSGA
jgi:hypothetical protein